ncbi:MAG TPA: type I restriction endonuclease, partial [Bryobacteraceae bacterium]|nr:type I restriction endonuclease [Bryobacteraceae bacterium]
MNTFTESVVEEAALAWLEGLGWGVLHGPDIGPDGENRLRGDYREALLEGRLYEAIVRLNPELDPYAVRQVLAKAMAPEGSSPEMRNRAFHRMLVDGVTVEHKVADGSIRGAQARIIDFDDPDNNEFLAINQYTVVGEDERRPDVLLFINGLPIGVIELKNAADENTDIWKAFNQLDTYKTRIPELFKFN